MRRSWKSWGFGKRDVKTKGRKNTKEKDVEMEAKRVIEPAVVGLAGRLEASEEGMFFSCEVGRVQLNDEETQKNLRSNDRLTGWLQCFRGWTVQPEERVARWIEETSGQGNPKGPRGEVRAVFRVVDCERLGGRDRTELCYMERKRLIDRLLIDTEVLRKNPYLVLENTQAQRFMNSQPPLSQWLNHPADRIEIMNVFPSERRIAQRTEGELGGGFDLRTATGWMDLKAVEDKYRAMEKELVRRRAAIEEKDLRIRTLEGTLHANKRLCKAGEKYLERLRKDGERCLRAICHSDDLDGRLERFSMLFEETDAPLEMIERQTEALRHQVEELFPTEPVARSRGLDLGFNRGPIFQWDSFRFQERTGKFKSEQKR